jgi:hypothetical protein
MATIARRIEELPPDCIVIAGAADGADQLAMKAATLGGLHTAVVYAMWNRYGKSAGPRRNRAMLDLEPDRVIAFSLGSRGTQDCIDEARRRGIPVEVVGREEAAMAL